MNIAAYSLGWQARIVSYQANLTLTRVITETARVNGQKMTRTIDASTKKMELSIKPHLGAHIDYRI